MNNPLKSSREDDIKRVSCLRTENSCGAEISKDALMIRRRETYLAVSSSQTVHALSRALFRESWIESRFCCGCRAPQDEFKVGAPEKSMVFRKFLASARIRFQNMNSNGVVWEVFFEKLLSYHNLIMACCENVFSVSKIFHQRIPRSRCVHAQGCFNLYAFHSNSISPCVLNARCSAINYNPTRILIRCVGGDSECGWIGDFIKTLPSCATSQRTATDETKKHRRSAAFLLPSQGCQPGASWSESWIIKAMITFWLVK